MLVFVYHAFRANLLWMGVDLFFVLSGFLITSILLNEKNKPFGQYIGDFYARRVRRIVPAYVVILVICAFIFGLGWLRYWYLYLGAMNLVIPMHLPYLEVLPLWSLAVEEQFYLLWPLAVFLLSRRQLTGLAVLVLVAAPALRFVCTPLFSSHYAIYMLSPFRMDTLAAGALVAICWPKLRGKLHSDPLFRSRLKVAGSVLFFTGLVTALVLNGRGLTPTMGSRVGNTFLLEATLGITGGMFFLALLGVGQKFLSSWPLVKLGRISYSIYLFHLTALYLAPKNNGFIAFAMSIAYATAMWFLVESPILSHGKKTRRTPQPAA